MRRLLLLELTAALAVLSVIVAVIVRMTDNKYEDGAMVVTWQEGSVQPLMVQGMVLSQGRPVANRRVTVETGSGADTVATGTDGSFSLNVGEPELRSLDVEGAGRIDWGLIGGPSLRNGVRFRIELKR